MNSNNMGFFTTKQHHITINPGNLIFPANINFITLSAQKSYIQSNIFHIIINFQNQNFHLLKTAYYSE
jgi:hypothetical protein